MALRTTWRDHISWRGKGIRKKSFTLRLAPSAAWFSAPRTRHVFLDKRLFNCYSQREKPSGNEWSQPGKSVLTILIKLSAWLMLSNIIGMVDNFPSDPDWKAVGLSIQSYVTGRNVTSKASDKVVNKEIISKFPGITESRIWPQQTDDANCLQRFTFIPSSG